MKYRKKSNTWTGIRYVGEIDVKPIILETAEFRLKGNLNHSVAAEEFHKRLPITLSLRRNETEYYTCVARGVFEPNELQVGWENGDLLLWDGCFVIDFGGAPSTEQGLTMVIGHIDGYQKLKELQSIIRLTIRAEEGGIAHE